MDNQTVSDMLRTTASNNLEFLTRIAKHIEDLNEYITVLETKVVDLGGTLSDKT